MAETLQYIDEGLNRIEDKLTKWKHSFDWEDFERKYPTHEPGE
jgi:hypothetical protein